PQPTSPRSVIAIIREGSKSTDRVASDRTGPGPSVSCRRAMPARVLMGIGASAYPPVAPSIPLQTTSSSSGDLSSTRDPDATDMVLPLLSWAIPCSEPDHQVVASG